MGGRPSSSYLADGVESFLYGEDVAVVHGAHEGGHFLGRRQVGGVLCGCKWVGGWMSKLVSKRAGGWTSNLGK